MRLFVVTIAHLATVVNSAFLAGLGNELKRVSERRGQTGELRYQDGPEDPTTAIGKVAVLVPEKQVSETHFMRWADVLASSFTMQQIDPSDLKTGKLSDENFDALIVPGGSIFEVEKNVSALGGRVINEFVSDGGGYLGSCCGAFLASRHGYGGSMEDYTMLGTSDGGYYAGLGEAVCQLTPEGQEILNGEKSADGCTVLNYRNGQTFGPMNASKANTILNVEIPAAIPLLRLRGVRTDQLKEEWSDKEQKYAAVAGEFGKGRILVFGPHPEATLTGGADQEAARRWIVNGLKWTLQKK